MIDELLPNRENIFDGVVRPLQATDIPELHPVLETWIRDRLTQEPLPDEVNEVMQAMAGSIAGENNRTYLVAETIGGQVIGTMGFRPPEGAMLYYVATDKSAELINAYVAREHRGGKGTGKALLRGIEKSAKQAGYKEIILNSGPRYRQTAWGFYTGQYGEPVAQAIGMYGEGGDAPVWRKSLETLLVLEE